jgi:hypothetical protein
VLLTEIEMGTENTRSVDDVMITPTKVPKQGDVAHNLWEVAMRRLQERIANQASQLVDLSFFARSCERRLER